MKTNLVLSATICTLALALAGEAWRIHTLGRWHIDGQIAAGEWKTQVQAPPCDGVRNLQVIWPKEAGAPLTIECDSMPVPTR